MEEETDNKEGKGRRWCLGDAIHSMPCRTTYLAPGRVEEWADLYPIQYSLTRPGANQPASK